jgi:uncharacterized membrane protein YjgN (DUF898 family)
MFLLYWLAGGFMQQELELPSYGVYAPVAPQTQVHRFRFTGSASEYFRIWIVNVFLTIVTAGIYAAWAKVRTRQYFYANTQLAGHSFEYLGQPLPILKGNLIVGGLFLVYSLVTNFAPLWAGAAGLLLAVAFPYLIFQSLRFLALNSAYRNIRFRFHGNLTDSYIHYMLLNLLTVPTVGLILPYVVFRQRQWVFNNASFGTLRTQFLGKSNAFYGIYGAALGMGIVAAIPLFLVATVLIGGAMRDGTRFDPSSSGVLLSFGLVYAAFFAVFALLQQFIYARVVNYTLNNTVAGGFLRFSSNLSAGSLIGIRITNFFAILFSLGLLSPWAKVRYVQYLLAHISISTTGDLDHIGADLSEQQNSAIGDAATDFMNVDIGL